MSDIEAKVVISATVLLQVPIIAHVHDCPMESCPWNGFAALLMIVGCATAMWMYAKRI